MKIYSARKFYKKTPIQKLIDIVCIPLIYTLPHEILTGMGLTSLRDERINICLANAKGHILDIGCGEGNYLIKKWNDGIGVDVFPWDGVDKVIDTTKLPFDDESFDTVTMLAVINHIVQRKQVLDECYRVLKKNGRILMTIPYPLVSFLRHKLAIWDKDQTVRGMSEGEVYGFSESEISHMLQSSKFDFMGHKKFALGLNHLYIGVKN